MLIPFYVALVVAALFYVLLPVIGAYFTRDQWRHFRERLLDVSRSPRLSLGPWSMEGGEIAMLGCRRFHGEIEALEGEDRIWLRGPDLTAVVDLGNSWFHILADEGGDNALEGRYSLVERHRWSRVRVFPESARVFVGGAVKIEHGVPVFFDDPAEPLVIVSYEGDEANLLSRLIAGGRLGNEYWNPLSRASIAFGMGSLGIFFAFAGTHWLPTVLFLSIIAGLSPVICLLPPGLPFFFLYRRFWRRALDERVVRDLCRLPLRFRRGLSPGDEDRACDAPLPGGGLYRVRVSADLPEGVATFVPRPGDRGPWTIFTPESNDDPEIGRLAVAGDPGELARRAERSSLTATFLSGCCLAVALLTNVVVAFLVWRSL